MTRATKLLLGCLPPVLLAAGLYATAAPASAVAYGGYSDWKSVSAGHTRTCAIRTNGKIYCFNTNGTGSSLFSISGYSDWKSVSVGASHQCAIRGSGVLYCWGSDTYGQVGNGSAGSASSPQRIGTASDWRSVSAGGRHTCAIRGSGFLRCWGDDTSGQAGNGPGVASPTAPSAVSGTASDWKSVSAGGAHTCAIRGSGLLRCWGSDASGQAGNGSLGSPTTPDPVDSSATNWRSVSAGSTHTCGILGTGLAACWGSDSRGQLGNGGDGSRLSPSKVNSALTDWKSASAGGEHTCGIRGSGALYCWGDNSAGQSSSATDPAQSPDRYGTLNDWRTADTGYRHTCAIRGSGSLYCWGAQTPPSNGLPAGTQYPAKILDLRRWKLTIPYDGSDAGSTADEIKWPALGTYISRSFFHANSANNAVVFRSPVGGAKTGGSVFARSEMRERTLWNGSSQTNCNWSNRTGTHILWIRQAVTHLPPRIPRVVVGQIHDPRDEVVMIRVDGSTIIAEASYPDPAYEDGRKVQRTLATGYKLGTPFTIKITANSKGVYVAYNGGTPTLFAGRVARNASPDKTTGDGWFFKAGLYLQTNTAKGEAPDQYGEGVISSLSIYHSNGQCPS